MQLPGQTGDEEKQQKREQEEQARRDVLSTVLDTAARERCASCEYGTVGVNKS